MMNLSSPKLFSTVRKQINLTTIATISVMSIASAAFSFTPAWAQDTKPAAPAMDAKPATANRPSGVRSVPVCAMKLEPLKLTKGTPAISSEFNGKKALFCCEDCKAAFEKLDDAGKEKKLKSPA